MVSGRMGGAFAGNDGVKCIGICELKYAVQDVDSVSWCMQRSHYG